MSHKRKGQLTVATEWAKHLRKYLKRQFWKAERKAGQGMITKELKEKNYSYIALAIGGLNGFASTEVQYSTFVLRLKFSAKNPAHRQYAARYMAF